MRLAVKEDDRCDLHTPTYHLLGADLRQHNELWSKLEAAELDYNAPTIILAECVLVYLDAMPCYKLLNSIAQRFSNCAFINYEQVCQF